MESLQHAHDNVKREGGSDVIQMAFNCQFQFAQIGWELANNASYTVHALNILDNMLMYRVPNISIPKNEKLHVIILGTVRETHSHFYD